MELRLQAKTHTKTTERAEVCRDTDKTAIMLVSIEGG